MAPLPFVMTLASTDPTADPTDLAPLRELVGNARVVALGRPVSVRR